MAEITISQLLGWQKVVKDRLAELTQLRDRNSYRENRYLGANADKNIVRDPVYDVHKLDQVIGRLHKETRLIDEALKNANATLKVPNYTQDDSVLGEVEVNAAAITPAPTK